MSKRVSKRSIKFQQGYACALSCIVRMSGIDTDVKEALVAGGLTSMEALRKYQIDPIDVEVLIPAIKQLIMDRCYPGDSVPGDDV